MPTPGKEAESDQGTDIAEPGASRPELRGLFLFLFTLAAGTGSIVESGPWWIPALLVGGYSLVLWRAQETRAWVLSETLKDSPYYLGFLLTQIALVQTFMSYSSDGQAVGGLDAVTFGIATALSTSIVGLIFRQIVILTDPIAIRRRSTLELLERQLEERISAYHDAQATFVSLVREFTEERTSLLANEKKQSGDYVRKLRATIRSLESSQESLADLVGVISSGLVQEVKNSSEAIVRQFGQASSAVKESGDRLSGNLSGLANDLRDAATELRSVDAKSSLEELSGAAQLARDSLASLRAEAESDTSVASEIGLVGRGLERDLAAIDQILSEFVGIAAKRIRELGELRSDPSK